jgi:hypothetical protein
VQRVPVQNNDTIQNWSIVCQSSNDRNK